MPAFPPPAFLASVALAKFLARAVADFCAFPPPMLYYSSINDMIVSVWRNPLNFPLI
jgi:hypothetical protein